MPFSFHATENLCVSGIMNWESFNHYYKTRSLQTNPLKKRELQEPFPYSLTCITIHLTPAFPVALFLKQIDFVLAIFDQQGNFGLPLVQPLNNWEEILTEYSFVQMRSEKIDKFVFLTANDQHHQTLGHRPKRQSLSRSAASHRPLHELTSWSHLLGHMCLASWVSLRVPTSSPVPVLQEGFSLTFPNLPSRSPLPQLLLPLCQV